MHTTGENPSNDTTPPPPPPQPRRHYSTILGYLNAGYTRPDLGRAGNYFQTHNNMQEMIIATEVERRRQIEADVRREMTIKREVMLRAARAHNFSMFSGPSMMPMNHTLPSLNHSEGTFSEVERRRLSEAEFRREMMVERQMELRETQAHAFSMFSGPSTMPMNHGLPMFNHPEGRSRDLYQRSHASEVKNETSINLPNPETDVPLLKRKAETPPPSASVTIPSLYPTKKKPKQERNNQKINKPKPTFLCEICQVSATSERNLQDHLEGKKHKSNAERKTLQITEPKFSINLCFKIAVNKDTLEEKPKEDDMEKVDEEKSDDIALKVSKNSEELKNNDDGVEFLFWCEMCKFGASSEEAMNDHRVGKEHLPLRLEAIAARAGNTGKGDSEL